MCRNMILSSQHCYVWACSLLAHLSAWPVSLESICHLHYASTNRMILIFVYCRLCWDFAFAVIQYCTWFFIRHVMKVVVMAC